MRTHTDTISNTALLSPVTIYPVISTRLLQRTMLKVSKAAKDLDISQKRYKELLEQIKSNTFVLDGNKKEEFISSDTHVDVLALFREKISPYSDIAIVDKDFQKAITEFTKKVKKNKKT